MDDDQEKDQQSCGWTSETLGSTLSPNSLLQAGALSCTEPHATLLKHLSPQQSRVQLGVDKILMTVGKIQNEQTLLQSQTKHLSGQLLRDDEQTQSHKRKLPEHSMRLLTNSENAHNGVDGLLGSKYQAREQ